MTLTTTTVSCPGKVLLTGGYLVLFDYPGLVLSLSSRFYCQVQNSTLIQITSPQFSDPVYNYPFDNVYVQTTVEMCLVFINHFKHSIPGFTLTLAADNDFYSQRSDMQQRGLSLCTKDLASLPKFNSLHCSISEVHKTGLGSSAAMISSIVGALLLHFDICSLDAQGKKWIHNLSQFCHCLAQGKIGSGFDVSSAIYGSHRYKRFSKQILEPFLEKATKRQLCSRELAAFITESEWNNEILDFSLPPQIEILMGDVDSGSNTPKLVSKVLAFCARDETLSSALFKKLDSLNQSLERNLRLLNACYETSPQEYSYVFTNCARTKADEWKHIRCSKDGESDTLGCLVTIHETFLRIRESMRELSRLSDAPIEPPEQTRLLDACMNIPGVLLAGVPGAGGYDAILCLTIGNEAKTRLEEMWILLESHQTICPMLSVVDSNGVQRDSSNVLFNLKPEASAIS